MIRPGKSTDAFALADLLIERHPDTRYAGKVDIVPEVARKMFAAAAQRHGGTNDGATFLMVHTDTHDIIDAFILGGLQRVYGIGDMLAACDIYLIGRKNCDPRAMRELISSYVAWAEDNPKVHEIGLSWSDTIPGNEAIMEYYMRSGFEQCSITFRRERQEAPVEGGSHQ